MSDVLRRSSRAGSGSPVDRLSRAVGHALLGRLTGGRIAVTEDRRTETFGRDGDIECAVRILDAGFWRRVVTRGGAGLAEAYMDHLWTTDDLTSVLRLLARNLDAFNRVSRNPLTRVRRALAAARRDGLPSEARDRRNISAHYDAGDDFFALFLDPTMAYSCALFERPDMSLEEASVAKFERICRVLGLTAESYVIEIGGGWGGFAVHAASRYGCNVTTTTISQRQAAYMRRRVQRAGLEDRVTVLDDHYRNLQGTYTHVVSVEMIEAVDWRLYDEYFATINRLLRPGGRAVIQAIVVDDREFERGKYWTDFVKRYIFPGGCLPSVAAMVGAAHRNGALELVDQLDIGSSYVTTLRRWREALDAHQAEAHALGWDDRRVRMWRYYFAYCEAGFAERRVSDVQLAFDGASR